MLFSSILFLYYFLPCMAGLYVLAPKRQKNTVLLFGSLFFYAWGEPVSVFLMVGSIVLGYGFGILLETCSKAGTRRIVCLLSVAVSLSFLVCLKYADFLIANFNAITGADCPLLHTALPVGISFYTFQMISYTIDVYRGTAAQKNLVQLAVYIAMFPQLIAGPIVRYSDIAEELETRQHSFAAAAVGIRRFMAGLAKKALLANQLGEVCSVFRASEEKSVLFYWLYAVSVVLYIYFDFSGYSDMAIGLGRLFGFHFPENFNYPYMASSITEFWRRWHITLGTWFRDYVYIPLGGNRMGRKRQLRLIFLVWGLTGFWHGASWNFLVWGLFFGVLLAIEKVWLFSWLEKNKAVSHIYVLFLVMISFLIFHAQNMAEACSDIRGLFGVGEIPLVSAEAVYCLRSYALTLMAAVLCAVPLGTRLIEKASKNQVCRKLINAMEPLVLLALLLLVTAYLADGSFQPFLYFRF